MITQELGGIYIFFKYLIAADYISPTYLFSRRVKNKSYNLAESLETNKSVTSILFYEYH